MKKIVSIIIIVFLHFSCGPGFSDYILDLGNGYYYLNEGGESNTIYFSRSKRNAIEKIIISSGVKKVNFNDKYVVLERIVTKDQILDSISDNLNSTFSFIEIQKTPETLKNSVYKNRIFMEKDSVIFKKLNSLGFDNTNSINDKKILRVLSDSIFNENDRLNKIVKKEKLYYIISKKGHKIYGGFSEVKFMKKKLNLGIGEELNLEN